jgi:hypothetical membrane protein
VITLHWPRAAGFSALLAPVIMWTEFFGFGSARSGYNLLTRPFSDLATRGTPNSTWFDIGFFLVPGLLTVMVGIGLWFALRGGRTWRLGAILIVAAGAFLFATGVFRQDPASHLARELHGTISQICFAIASVAPLVLFIGSGRHGYAGPPRRLWLAAGAASLAIELIAVGLREVHAAFPEGLFQRPFTLVLTVWFVATGAWLLKVRRIEGLSVTG